MATRCMILHGQIFMDWRVRVTLQLQGQRPAQQSFDGRSGWGSTFERIDRRNEGSHTQVREPSFHSRLLFACLGEAGLGRFAGLRWFLGLGILVAQAVSEVVQSAIGGLVVTGLVAGLLLDCLA